MQEIMTCQNCLIGWMESAARNFTYPLGMKTALYKKRKKVEKSPFFRFFGSLSNFGVLKCLCTPGEDMH